MSVGVGDTDQAIAVFDLAVDLRLSRSLLSDTSSSSTDVERTQRELRARLTDRLCRDDTNCLSLIDHRHGRQVAAVAHLAESALRFAREYGTNANSLDSRIFDLTCHVLVDQLTGFRHQ